MSELIISVSGLRGIVGETLTPEVAARFVSAFVAELPAGPIVVTRDGRASGPMLAEAICAALTAVGRNFLNFEVCATPTTGVLVREHAAAGGLQISASHNPAEYNGLKLFNAAGRVIPADEGQKVIDRFRNGSSDTAPSSGKGSSLASNDAIGRHLDLVCSTVDVERIRAATFRVLLDANHGAGSRLGVPLLERLGCRVTVLGGTADGAFEHVPEPTAENLSGVLNEVRACGAQIGFCQDPDADRLAVIDSAGNYLGEEYTLAMCVDHVLRQTPGPIVTNCSTSRMSEDVATKYGVPFFRSAVGEANVIDLMLAKEAVLGGEGNGGVIDPRVVLVRDSIVSMALLLDAMAGRELKISQLAAELPRYEICKTKVTIAREKIFPALDAIEKHFPGATADRLDGLRLDWSDGRWLLIRASNTEPIVRVVAEAKSVSEAEQLCQATGDILGSF